VTCAAGGKRPLWPWLSLLLALSLSWPTYAEPLTKSQEEALLLILDELSTGASQTRQGLNELTQGLNEIKSGLETSRQGSQKALTASERAETASLKALKETELLQVDLSEQRQELATLRQGSAELTAQLKDSVDLSRKIEGELFLWKAGAALSFFLALIGIFT